MSRYKVKEARLIGEGADRAWVLTLECGHERRIETEARRGFVKLPPTQLGCGFDHGEGRRKKGGTQGAFVFVFLLLTGLGLSGCGVLPTQIEACAKACGGAGKVQRVTADACECK